MGARLMHALLGLAIAITAACVAARPASVGADTSRYIDYYLRYPGLLEGRFEPGFSLLTGVIRGTGASVEIYFAAVYAMLCAGLLAFFVVSGDRYKRRVPPESLLVFFAALLFSRWFENAAINGLRQGIAAPFVFFAILYLGRAQYTRAAAMGALAVLFHSSAALALLVSPLVLVSARMQAWIFFASCIGYISGLTATLVRAVPTIAGINIYNKIVEYASDNPLWLGLDIRFVAYTVFFMCIFLIAVYLADMSSVFREYVRIYSALSCVYFMFGFAAYSNRYALYAWLFASVPLARMLCELFEQQRVLVVAGGVAGVMAGVGYFCIRLSDNGVF